MARNLLLSCLCVAAILLAACAPIQPQPVSVAAPDAAAAPAAEPTSDLAVFEIGDTGIVVPENIAGGLVAVEVRNTGSDVHAAIFRRLNDDVTFEEWQAMWAEGPMKTFPMTTLLGGPDLYPGESLQAYLSLEPGLHIVVDNALEPPQYATFMVTERTGAEVAAPVADVEMLMTEYAFEAPATIQAGKLLWSFENAGAAPHQMGVVMMNEGAGLEEIVAWLETEEGPPPFEWVTFWNVMSPGTRSWGELSLDPGTYMLLDFLPDWSADGMPNLMQGMAAELTVE